MKKYIVILSLILIALSGCRYSELDKASSSEQNIVSFVPELSVSEKPILESSAAESLEESDEVINLSDFHIEGKYICSSDYFKDFIGNSFNNRSEAIPAITFYEDGNCELIINYLEGICCVYGIYSIEGEQVFTEIDLDGTIFISSGDDFYKAGTKFMDDQYVFSIVSNDEIVINKGFYAVNAGDTFVKSSP